MLELTKAPTQVRYHIRHAVHGALHFRIGEVVAGGGLLGLGLCQGGFGFQQGVLGRLQVEGRHHLIIIERLLAVHRHTGGGHGGFGTLHVGFGGLQGRPIGHLVDDEQRLPFTHRGALVDAYLGDDAAHLRTYLHALPALHGGGVLARQGAVRRRKGQGFVQCPARLLRGLLASRKSHQAQGAEACRLK